MTPLFNAGEELSASRLMTALKELGATGQDVLDDLTEAPVKTRLPASWGSLH